MPKRNGHVPSYCLHKPSGQARVIVAGQHIYLGKYGSPESREKYARLIAEMSADEARPVAARPNCSSQPEISINEMLLSYWQFSETYYCKDGEPTKELECMKEAMWPLRQLYGSIKAGDFGPQALKAVRQHMISEQKLCRNVVNRRIGRIKRVFKWAVAEELVASSTYHGLQALTGLRYGRSEARETEPIKPVDDQYVDAVLPFVTPHVAAMIQVQRLTGMRPSDVCKMRPSDINRSADVWIFEPYEHKNRWRGHPPSLSLATGGTAGPLWEQLAWCRLPHLSSIIQRNCEWLLLNQPNRWMMFFNPRKWTRSS